MAIQISGTTVIDNSRNITNCSNGSFSSTVTVGTPTSSSHATTKSYVDGLVGGGGAKVWVNFNGTGTVSIRADYNVSSITDNGSGNYTLNFSSSLSDANYAVLTTTGTDLGTRQTCVVNSRSSSSTNIYSYNDGGALLDTSYLGVAIFR
jgi:hypothetical protein